MKASSLILASLIFASASAHAAPSPTGQTAAAQTPTMDTRCFMVASAAAENLSDPKMKQMAVMSSLFYLGRMSARMSDSEMGDIALKEAKALTTANMQTLLQQCGSFMAQRGKAIEAIGERIGKETQAPAGGKK